PAASAPLPDDLTFAMRSSPGLTAVPHEGEQSTRPLDKSRSSSLNELNDTGVLRYLTLMKNPSGFACFGELLLRLSAPGNELLLQSGSLAVHIGGAEANVAVSLARFGHEALMASVVPDNPLGQACIGELRRHGVRTEAIHTGPGRMGLYFLTIG